jgi:hypothetical protein
LLQSDDCGIILWEKSCRISIYAFRLVFLYNRSKLGIKTDWNRFPKCHYKEKLTNITLFHKCEINNKMKNLILLLPHQPPLK